MLIKIFKNIFLIVIIIIFTRKGYCQFSPDNEKYYSIADWQEDTLGNHRAVIEVIKKSDAVYLHLPWRRSDKNPEEKNIYIFDINTGKRIDNRVIINCNREFGDIVFQPVTTPGKYFVYYFPYRPEGMYYWGDIKYISPEETAEQEWLIKNKLTKNELSKNLWKKLPSANLIQFQARGEVNNFYPMEIIASQSELKSIIEKNKEAEYLLFPEDRKYPIRMTEDIPYRWFKNGPKDKFEGEAQKNEGYSFQIGVFAIKKDILDLDIKFSDLISIDGKNRISSSDIFCINMNGVDWKGEKIDKIFDVKKRHIRALWIEILIPENIKSGDYLGEVKIMPKEMRPSTIKVKLNIGDQVLKDRGDNEPWKHSRLRWLNSKIALDDSIVKPYIPMKRNADELMCLGRKVVLNKFGFPKQICSYFTPEITEISETGREILSDPITFTILDSDKKPYEWNAEGYKIEKENEGVISWKISNSCSDFILESISSMEFDGHLEFLMTLTAKKAVKVRDMYLSIPIKKEIAKYSMGMNLRGGLRPDKHEWKWDANRHQDAIWIGDVNAGLQLKLKGENYQRPLVNLHYKHKKIKMPPAWYNEYVGGRGGVQFFEIDSTLMLKAFSGERKIKAGEKLNFYFTLLITPLKTLDTKGQFTYRYFHYPERKLYPIDSIALTGANIINVHHANAANPYLNYPFLTANKMKEYVDEAHAKGFKLKIYYTTREISNHVVETAAWRSLGEEIYAYGPGGGNASLREHYYDNYIPAWYERNWKDACIINSGMSRLHNYYLEGLNWLTTNVGIDGLYLDDVAFDRIVMKRTRKILDRTRPNPQIDLHSWNHYNELAGFANNINLYMENLPYVNRLWLGEVFDYNNTSPDYWLIEISGIPFGLMSEMLQDGGNPWRGMIFGMTNRLPWLGDPRALWKIWDEFGIKESEMIGFWSPNCPVKTNNLNILSTVYQKKDKALISLGSWNDEPVKCKLNIDWIKLGFNPEEMILEAPYIEKFQDARTFKVNENIPIEPERGWLLVLRKR